MMPRKTRRMIIMIAMVVLLSIVAIAFLLLYMNTDMFKSNATLFMKYMGQNLENMEEVYNGIGTSDYHTLLQQNKHTNETQVKVNYTSNIGTSIENTENSINQLQLKINGQTDKNNGYNHQNIHLLSNDEQVSEIEYIQNGITYGIKFSDLFSQYILADNENVKELFRKMGYTEEQLENIPDTLEFNNDLKSIFEFSKEEKENLKTKYSSIINSNVSKDNASKQKNQTIQMDGKDIKTNSYILTLTKEQLNNIYIKILEEAKQDEMILTKIDNLQMMLNPYQFAQTQNLREEFVNKIEEIIENITKNNIGKEETKIIVYENNQTTIRTVVQHPDYEITIDSLKDYIQIAYQNTTSKNEKIFTYKRENGQTSIDFIQTKDEETKQYSLKISEEVQENHCLKNTVIQYKDDSNRLQVMIEQAIDIVDNFENETVLNEENSINLSKLDARQVREILNKVNSSVSGKVDEITTISVKMEDLTEVLKTIGIVKEQRTLEAMGITETEKNRFNSQFEILQGEELNGDTVLNLINAIRQNLIDLEVVSNAQLKLKLDRFNKNEEIANNISSFIEENKNKKYNAKVEYDEETGLVSDILLIMLEE